MLAYGEAAPREAINAWNATRQLEDSAALVAMEVVMVRLSRTLVHGRGAWQVNGRKPTLFQQCLDVPVNGSDPQTLHVGLRRHQHLLGRERSIGLFECFPNCSPLSGVPLVFLGHLPAS